MAKNLQFPPKAIGFIFTFVALIVIVIGAWVNTNNKELEKRCTDTVTASVVENIREKTRTRTKHGHRTVTKYRPVFNFTYNGQNYRVESSSSRKPALFDVNEKTEIKVNPSDPYEIYVPADKTYGKSGLICIAAGVLFLIIGILAIIKS